MIKHLSTILVKINSLVVLVIADLSTRQAIIKNKIEARRLRKETVSLMVDFAYSEIIEAMDRGEQWAIEFVLNKWG